MDRSLVPVATVGLQEDALLIGHDRIAPARADDLLTLRGNGLFEHPPRFSSAGRWPMMDE